MDNLKEINYGQAIYEGCYQEMEKDDSVFVTRKSNDRKDKELHGLYRALIQNMVRVFQSVLKKNYY